MRLSGSCIVWLLTIASAVQAQNSKQENLDSVLRGWEKSMTDLKNFTCVVQRESLDKALQAKDVNQGYAMFSKPVPPMVGIRAMLHLGDINTKAEEKYILSGGNLHEFVAAQKLIRVHQMPPGKGGSQQESFLFFLFGMGAKEAKKRYEMTLDFPNNGTDKFYDYISIKPKLDRDRSDFTAAQLVLFRANHLPARIWVRQPNGKEITWNFTELRVDLQTLHEKAFDTIPPKGWKMVILPPN